MTKTLTVDSDSGQRLDVAAGHMLPSLSRAYIHKLIDSGRITLNGSSVKAGVRVHAGDTIRTDFDETELDIIPDIDLPVLYEDKDVIVVNKPTGVISHSRGKYWNEPSVASFVRQKTGQAGERAGLVHRLDRATSGVMICAKNTTALAWLQKQFSNRQVDKRYVAIVAGKLVPSEAIIDIPIARNPKAPATFRPDTQGKVAQTKYHSLRSNGKFSLVELQPLTGRTHQLRVHLQHLGHPIVGDTLYGGTPAERLMLHAWQLKIRLPDTQLHEFLAPIPPEFNQLVGTNG